LPGNTGRDRHARKENLPSGGGAEFRMIPALNDRPEWVDAITQIVRSFEPGASTRVPTATYGGNS
jgi:hypothetical protein